MGKMGLVFLLTETCLHYNIPDQAALSRQSAGCCVCIRAAMISDFLWKFIVAKRTHSNNIIGIYRYVLLIFLSNEQHAFLAFYSIYIYTFFTFLLARCWKGVIFNCMLRFYSVVCVVITLHRTHVSVFLLSQSTVITGI